MSIYFVTEDEQDVWNPSGITGRLFCDQVESVARIIGVETGLGPIVSDEVVVHAVLFKTFAASLAGLVLRTDPKSGARILLDGCFAIAGALACRLGACPPEIPELVRLVANGRTVIG